MATTVTLRHITKVFRLGKGTHADSSDGHLDHHRGAAESGKPGFNPASSADEEDAYLRALDDISMTVRPGETLGVLGPSGCGKTTLLRIVAGLEPPTGGEVLYDGQRLEDIPPRERGIGMVFQNYALYPHLPNVDNIGFFLKLRKREVEVPARVREISAFMQIDLEPLLSRKPPSLSGGEQQRVAIARCLARDPRVFLFDEPFSNLDAKLRTTARIELNRLLRRYNVTSIYVTHDQTEAFALSQRIAIMREGRLEQIGTFAQLYERPANTFVAGFLGKPAMNLFPGYTQDGMWIGQAFDWGPIRNDLDNGTRIVLGVRPEHLFLDEDGGLIGRVELIERIFSERIQLVHIKIGPHQAIIRLPIGLSIQRGSQLRLSIMPDQVHLFDQESGTRLG